MLYRIEPIFILYPVFCLLLYVLGIGRRRSVTVLLSVAFLLIYSLSLNGSDFEGYRLMYRSVSEGASFRSLHGEVGYYYLQKLSSSLGIPYIAFRAVLLSTCSLVLFYGFSKLSENFALSMFFLSTMFVVYTISAYRQYIVIAFSILFIYLYDREKHWTAIIGLFFLAFFHFTAILPLGIVLYYSILSQNSKWRQLKLFSNHYILLLLIALTIRVAATIVMNSKPVEALVTRILAGHASPTPSLFSFGLLSRIVMYLCVTYIYRRSFVFRRSTQMLYWYYFISILLYVMVPLEFAMGRLINNANILLSVLIPALRFQHNMQNEGPGVIVVSGISYVVILAIFLALVVLVNQLLHQDGYTPYLNILLGDDPVTFAYK